jgi:hypothetical protein
MSLIPYFAYGSNMLTQRLRARCPSAVVRQIAWVDNAAISFSKKSQDKSGKATIDFAAGKRIFGVVFDLADADLLGLDSFEGVGNGYDRKDDFLIQIMGSDEPIKAVTYLANPASIDRALQPFDWYLALVIAGARQHALPPAYVGILESTPARRDPKGKRPSRLEALGLLDRLSH